MVWRYVVWWYVVWWYVVWWYVVWWYVVWWYVVWWHVVWWYVVWWYVVWWHVVWWYVVWWHVVWWHVVWWHVVWRYLVRWHVVRSDVAGPEMGMIHKPGPTARVWALSIAVASTAAVLIWAQVGQAPRNLSHLVPWWVFVGLFYLAEVTVLHFRFRRHVHSFSMSEVPLIIGIVLLSPVQLHAVHIIGSALALAIARRQSLVKLAFNVSQIALQVSVATLLFNSIVGSGDPLGPAVGSVRRWWHLRHTSSPHC